MTKGLNATNTTEPAFVAMKWFFGLSKKNEGKSLGLLRSND
jgi:hypothetical protein